MVSPDRRSSIHLKDATVSASLRSFRGPFPLLFFVFLLDSQQAFITTAVILEYLSVGMCPYEVQASGRQVLLLLGTTVLYGSVLSWLCVNLRGAITDEALTTQRLWEHQRESDWHWPLRCNQSNVAHFQPVNWNQQRHIWVYAYSICKQTG